MMRRIYAPADGGRPTRRAFDISPGENRGDTVGYRGCYGRNFFRRYSHSREIRAMSGMIRGAHDTIATRTRAHSNNVVGSPLQTLRTRVRSLSSFLFQVTCVPVFADYYNHNISDFAGRRSLRKKKMSFIRAQATATLSKRLSFK